MTRRSKIAWTREIPNRRDLMFMRTIGRPRIKPFIFCALVGVLSLAVPPAKGQTPAPSGASASNSEIEQLRQMILEQQRQINELKRQMADQKSQDSTVAATPAAAVAPAPSRSASQGVGQVASTVPILPPLPAATTLGIPLPQAAPASRGSDCCCSESLRGGPRQDYPHLLAAGQRLYHPRRLYGFHSVLARQERRIEHGFQLRRRSVQQRIQR